MIHRVTPKTLDGGMIQILGGDLKNQNLPTLLLPHHHHKKEAIQISKKKRWLSQPRKEFKNVEELLKVFKKVEVNLPLLAAIKSIPRYAKFLKELCTHKRRSRSQEKENGIELKVLPSNLKYVFLGENNIYPVTISKELTGGQEARLLETLKRHRQTIGWSLEDIKRIDPSFCTHRIHLEERTKNKVQPQRRLNPTLKEVVKKEVLKLKDVVIIYPILHST
ncbi:Retrovirus-related Pol polyprotein from transposon 297 family [Cucumis melo var. makuwa]|uniref:Retrovirus-related Pol polyprotein from transposon 297 family n=1 Tax=Cucumis melo var. makuwa TaxID=1194695 RepID=A0A5A7VG00_CUCMM|nr:Retrovirus-related Pol polyprotein from transposon 297 family [Cucumis melo var. makuwa]